ncbi:hypothetical protein CEUSTIGMA_g6741.t1 [Chlamydomonas eustigma]|uniref:Uncharacterized protein n=1 Tax=Chlamydomonas eustigma TaxID=1157962 RepID=A0A250X952_9CHLO|nr:hypothetical protein CEUSTIGMA_g6741.t1 [Chlamydomonas eustigma]|eukprot:GAX79300.1 hypothetical protein CEUSTIGMA_g6741.t1 [Chlamydomonas eustigma]
MASALNKITQLKHKKPPSSSEICRPPSGTSSGFSGSGHEECTSTSGLTPFESPPISSEDNSEFRLQQRNDLRGTATTCTKNKVLSNSDKVAGIDPESSKQSKRRPKILAGGPLNDSPYPMNYERQKPPEYVSRTRHLRVVVKVPHSNVQEAIQTLSLNNIREDVALRLPTAMHLHATHRLPTAMHLHAAHKLPTAMHLYAAHRLPTAMHLHAAHKLPTAMHLHATHRLPTAMHLHAAHKLPTAMHLHAAHRLPTAMHLHAAHRLPTAMHLHAAHKLPTAMHLHAAHRLPTAMHLHAAHRLPTAMHLQSLTARSGCIILELRMLDRAVDTQNDSTCLHSLKLHRLLSSFKLPRLPVKILRELDDAGHPLPEMLPSGLTTRSLRHHGHQPMSTMSSQVMKPEDWLDVLGVQKLLPTNGGSGRANFQMEGGGLLTGGVNATYLYEAGSWSQDTAGRGWNECDGFSPSAALSLDVQQPRCLVVPDALTTTAASLDMQQGTEVSSPPAWQQIRLLANINLSTFQNMPPISVEETPLPHSCDAAPIKEADAKLGSFNDTTFHSNESAPFPLLSTEGSSVHGISTEGSSVHGISPISTFLTFSDYSAATAAPVAASAGPICFLSSREDGFLVLEPGLLLEVTLCGQRLPVKIIRVSGDGQGCSATDVDVDHWHVPLQLGGSQQQVACQQRFHKGGSEVKTCRVEGSSRSCVSASGWSGSELGHSPSALMLETVAAISQDLSSDDDGSAAPGSAKSRKGSGKMVDGPQRVLVELIVKLPEVQPIVYYAETGASKSDEDGTRCIEGIAACQRQEQQQQQQGSLHSGLLYLNAWKDCDGKGNGSYLLSSDCVLLLPSMELDGAWCECQEAAAEVSGVIASTGINSCKALLEDMGAVIEAATATSYRSPSPLMNESGLRKSWGSISDLPEATHLLPAGPQKQVHHVVHADNSAVQHPLVLTALDLLEWSEEAGLPATACILEECLQNLNLRVGAGLREGTSAEAASFNVDSVNVRSCCEERRVEGVLCKSSFESARMAQEGEGSLHSEERQDRGPEAKQGLDESLANVGDEGEQGSAQLEGLLLASGEGDASSTSLELDTALENAQSETLLRQVKDEDAPQTTSGSNSAIGVTLKGDCQSKPLEESFPFPKPAVSSYWAAVLITVILGSGIISGRADELVQYLPAIIQSVWPYSLVLLLHLAHSTGMGESTACRYIYRCIKRVCPRGILSAVYWLLGPNVGLMLYLNRMIVILLSVLGIFPSEVLTESMVSRNAKRLTFVLIKMCHAAAESYDLRAAAAAMLFVDFPIWACAFSLTMKVPKPLAHAFTNSVLSFLAHLGVSSFKKGFRPRHYPYRPVSKIHAS